jgi:putative DNA methylase
MPLVRSFWLSKKKGNETWIRPILEPGAKHVHFEIEHGKEGPPIEGSKVGRGAKFKCLICNQPAEDADIKAAGLSGRMGAQLMAIVAESNRQRVYLPPSEEHERAAEMPRPVNYPDTELAIEPRAIWCVGYGLTHHADLFTNRQLTVLCTLSDLVGEAHKRVLSDSGGDASYADSVATYLAFVMDKMTDTNSSLCSWQINPPRLRATFGRQALPMVWDFAEANPFGGAAGDYGVTIQSEREVIEMAQEKHSDDLSRPSGHCPDPEG